MAAFNRFNIFSENLAEQVHKLDTDLLKVYLSNTAPDAALDAVKADLAEITAGNGYPAGGVDVQNNVSRVGLVVSITAVDVVITASGGSVGPFQYAVLYNDTPASPLDPLIGWWDNGSPITLLDSESLTVNFTGDVLFTVG